jgi:hypothetical protein
MLTFHRSAMMTASLDHYRMLTFHRSSTKPAVLEHYQKLASRRSAMTTASLAHYQMLSFRRSATKTASLDHCQMPELHRSTPMIAVLDHHQTREFRQWAMMTASLDHYHHRMPEFRHRTKKDLPQRHCLLEEEAAYLHYCLQYCLPSFSTNQWFPSVYSWHSGKNPLLPDQSWDSSWGFPLVCFDWEFDFCYRRR